MKPLAPAAALVMLLVLAAPSGATHCETYRTIPAQHDTGETAAGRYYAHLAFCQLACTYELTVYQESNGIDGWQPKDDFFDATCHDIIAPDTQLWVSGL